MTQSLSVSLKPSRMFALALTAMAAAALACAWISLPRVAFFPLAAGIALAWAWHCAQALQWARSSVRVLELDAQGGGRCRDGRDHWHDAAIMPGSYVSRWLIVVNLGGDGRRRRSLVLLPDSAGADELRRLRVWLRWRVGTNDAAMN